MIRDLSLSAFNAAMSVTWRVFTTPKLFVGCFAISQVVALAKVLS